MSFTKDNALDSSKKLKTKPRDRKLPRLQVLEQRDGPHVMQQIWCDGKLVNEFGIKHASNRNSSHGWVCRELDLSPREMYDFATCQMSIDEMILHFIDQGLIPPPKDDPADSNALDELVEPDDSP